MIPNKDHTDDLEKCLHSIWTKTSWENFEVIVIENNSTDPATFTYYKEARQRYDGLQVVNYPQKGFNFSGINNFGRQYASGDYLLLLNNDVEVRNGDWLTELLRPCAHPGGAAHPWRRIRQKKAAPFGAAFNIWRPERFRCPAPAQRDAADVGDYFPSTSTVAMAICSSSFVGMMSTGTVLLYSANIS